VTDRTRMVMNLPTYIQMAIRLRAIKARQTTGEAVTEAVRLFFPRECEEAANIYVAQKKRRKHKREATNGKVQGR
jgi:hypothetical protein